MLYSLDRNLRVPMNINNLACHSYISPKLPLFRDKYDHFINFTEPHQTMDERVMAAQNMHLSNIFCN